MPKFVTPDGRADLETATEHLIDYLKSEGTGVENIVTAANIAQMYDIAVWQARTCAIQARIQLRFEDLNLCARRGPGGGFFIAATEEEARLYSLNRSEFVLTEIENVTKDVETALRGIVRSAPATELYWRRTRNRLNNIAGELARVREELALSAARALPEGDDDPNGN
jgi:hypothetical protein